MALQGSKTAKALIVLSAFVPNLFMTEHARAQATASDILDMRASIINPLQLTPSFSFSLNFNSFAIKGTGTYKIAPTGGTNISNGVPIAGITAGTAVLRVPQNADFTISIPTYKTASIVMKNAGGGVPSKEMTVKSIFISSKSNMSNATETFKNGNHLASNMKITDVGGVGKIAVGARITFDPIQATGQYVGTFIVRLTL